MTENLQERFQTLHEIVRGAHQTLDPGAWYYLAGGTETETTLRRNRQALDSIAFRPRVLRNVANVDLTTTFLGRTLRLPVLTAPIGGLETFDAGGGASVARATGQVIPRPLRQAGMRGFDDLVQVLESVFES